jgi:hypothetical protein
MAQKLTYERRHRLLRDYNDKGNLFSHMTIEQLAETDYQLDVLEPATPGQTRFDTTNAGLYLRNKAANAPPLRSYILSDDEGHEAVITKERRYWLWRARTCLVAKQSPDEIQQVRDGWYRHQRLLEGPLITSKAQVDWTTVANAHAYDPTSLAYIIKVTGDIQRVVDKYEDIYRLLGDEFPTAHGVFAIRMLMGEYQNAAIFYADAAACQACRSSDIAKIGHPRRFEDGKYTDLAMPCGRPAILDTDPEKYVATDCCHNCLSDGHLCDRDHRGQDTEQLEADVYHLVSFASTEVDLTVCQAMVRNVLCLLNHQGGFEMSVLPPVIVRKTRQTGAQWAETSGSDWIVKHDIASASLVDKPAPTLAHHDDDSAVTGTDVEPTSTTTVGSPQAQKEEGAVDTTSTTQLTKKIPTHVNASDRLNHLSIASGSVFAPTSSGAGTESAASPLSTASVPKKRKLELSQ